MYCANERGWRKPQTMVTQSHRAQFPGKSADKPKKSCMKIVFSCLKSLSRIIQPALGSVRFLYGLVSPGKPSKKGLYCSYLNQSLDQSL